MGPMAPSSWPTSRQEPQGLCTSPSVTELPPAAPEESPLAKKQRRLTLSAMTGALGDIAQHVEDLEHRADEDDELLQGSIATPRQACSTLQQRRRRMALTPMTGAALRQSVDGQAASSTSSRVAEAPPGGGHGLPQPPQRRVRRPVWQLCGGGTGASSDCAPEKRLSGQKRTRDNRESVGWTARADNMVETAKQSLKKKIHASEDSTTDEDDSFACRVRHAASFQIGVKSAGTTRGHDGDVAPQGAGIPGVSLGAFSRSAFKRGLRVSEVAAKVEAEMTATKSNLAKSLGVAPADSGPAGALGKQPFLGQPEALPIPQLQHAQVIASSLFNPKGHETHRHPEECGLDAGP